MTTLSRPDSNDASRTPISSRGRLLTIAWATTVAMWSIAYVTMMGPGLAVGEALVALMGAALFSGGFVAAAGGESSPSAGGGGGLRRGLGVGAISASVNLLLVGSLFKREDQIEISTALGWVATLYGSSLLLAGIGGLLGAMRARRTGPGAGIARSPRHWPGLFALVAMTTVFIMLITGGLVTGLKAGLAVHDWPNSFGHNMLLFPLSEMKGGIYYEHAHRLYGMLVGLTTIVLVVLLWSTDRRSWIKALALTALALVIVQGIMGGLRVTGEFTLSSDATAMRPNTGMAIVHGILGQVTFALLAVIAAATSRDWIAAPAPSPYLKARRDRTLLAITLAVLLVQLTLGVSYRQLRTWHEAPAWALHGHLTFAVISIVLVTIVALRAASLSQVHRRVAKLGRVVMMILGLQVALGVAALVVVLLNRDTELPIWGVAMTTAHQAIGAALIAHVAMLVAWHRRCVE